jgi:hypothetical protein
MYLPANPTAHRRELAHRERMRLAQIEGKLDRLVVEMGAAAKPSSTPTAEDAFYLAEVLASSGTEGLPHGSRVDCTTVDITTPLQKPYGKVFTTIATTVTIWPLEPMTPAEALLCGLLTVSGKLQPSVYERMIKEVPGIIEGRLIGPREAMMARQEAGKRARPWAWHA